MPKRPIRILELRSVYGTGGGPEKTILLGTARTDRSRFEITVCYLRRQDDPDFEITERAKAAGIDYVEIKERSAVDPAVWPQLRALVRSRRIDIVHAHEYKTDLLAWALAKVEPIVPLATAHAWTGHSLKERAVYYPGDKLLLARYPRVLAVSGEIKRELIAWGAKPDAVTVVLNGIDHRRFHRQPERVGEARTRFGLHDGEFAIGSVGRLEPQKRFDLLVAAFAEARRTRPGLRLLIAGEGSCRAELEQQIAALNLGAVCRLVGQCGDIPMFHHALDLFVQSSKYEGTPNVVLEAMALGTPLVATNVGGTAELVRDGVDGLIVPPLDLPALLHGMETALGDAGLRGRWAASARARVETDLSFDTRMATVEAVYEQLMDKRDPIPGRLAWSAAAKL